MHGECVRAAISVTSDEVGFVVVEFEVVSEEEFLRAFVKPL
jgi:hypothetical protein